VPLYNLTHISGSLVIALAVAEGHLPADQAFAAAQLDELYQIERWGEDPTSTLRHENIKHDIAAGARFLALLEKRTAEGMIMGAGTKFREVLAKSGLVEAMAAHSPLSAMLAAEAGFDAIWAVGLRALRNVRRAGT